MSYTHLSVIERVQLKNLVQQGYGVREIGRILGRPASCIENLRVIHPKKATTRNTLRRPTKPGDRLPSLRASAPRS